jgi:hypothetical protein
MAWDLKDYEPVEDRLREFWSEHPEGRISTELLHHVDGDYIVRASVWRSHDRDFGQDWPHADATGLAQDSVEKLPPNMKASALEVCETSAIGRALANLGYAAKGKRPSREEMQKSADVEPGPALSSTGGPEGQPQGAGKADADGSADTRSGEVRGDADPASGESLAYGEGAGGSPDTSEEEERQGFRRYLAERYGTAQALLLARELFQTKARPVKNMTYLSLEELQAIDLEFKARATAVSS